MAQAGAMGRRPPTHPPRTHLAVHNDDGLSPQADTDVAARVVSACKSNYLSVFALVAGAGSSILPGGGGGGGEL